MRKVLGIILSVFLILSLAACGSSQSSGNSQESKEEKAAETTVTADEGAAAAQTAAATDEGAAAAQTAAAADKGTAAAGTAAAADTVWSREGAFVDENGYDLYITPSDDEEYEGWYVSFMTEEYYCGWYIPQEGSTLHGDLNAGNDEEKPCVVTISEEGDDGVMLEVEDGDTYHFKPDGTSEETEETEAVLINTDGLGQIAYAEEGIEPEFDDEYPKQSAQLSPEAGTVYVVCAKADEGWRFVKWTKNGEDFSTEDRITVSSEESAEYIACFEEE